MVDELTAAVDAELGVLLTLVVRFLGEVVLRLRVTALEHPADFGPELTQLVVPKATTIARKTSDGGLTIAWVAGVSDSVPEQTPPQNRHDDG